MQDPVQGRWRRRVKVTQEVHIRDMDILGSFSPDDEAHEKTRGQRLTSWKKSSMGIVRKV